MENLQVATWTRVREISQARVKEPSKGNDTLSMDGSPGDSHLWAPLWTDAF